LQEILLATVFVGIERIWGEKGIQVNVLLAATAWNLKKMMEKLKDK
jgi:hypothetical protein